MHDFSARTALPAGIDLVAADHRAGHAQAEGAEAADDEGLPPVELVVVMGGLRGEGSGEWAVGSEVGGIGAGLAGDGPNSERFGGVCQSRSGGQDEC